MRGVTTERTPLPDGDAGTAATLARMRGLASDGAKELVVRQAAIAALMRDGAQERDPRSALAALHRFIQDRIYYVDDPVGTQAVQSPRVTLGLGAGNCAQRATLLAAMAQSIGIPADLRFRAIAADPRYRDAFSHVYVVARINGQDMALDPTYRGTRPGFEYGGAFRRMDYPVMRGTGCGHGCRCDGPEALPMRRLVPTLAGAPGRSWVHPARMAGLPDARALIQSRVATVRMATVSSAVPMTQAAATAPSGTAAQLIRGEIQRVVDMLSHEIPVASQPPNFPAAVSPASQQVLVAETTPSLLAQTGGTAPQVQDVPDSTTTSSPTPADTTPSGPPIGLILAIAGGLLLFARAGRKAA